MNRVLAASVAQISAQALTAWAVVLSVVGGGEVSIWVVVPLAAAGIVPSRHDGTLKDRAVANFGASVTMGGVVWWEAMAGLMGGIGGSGGAFQTPYVLIMLTASALFTFAGAFFWTKREERP